MADYSSGNGGAYGNNPGRVSGGPFPIGPTFNISDRESWGKFSIMNLSEE